MLKKTKEKINNNEYIILFKKIWSNKRYRSILILVVYLVFFGIIIGGMRSSYEDIDINQNNDTKKYTIVDKKNNWNNYKSDYLYQIIYKEKVVAIGKVEDGIQNLTVNNKKYTIINDNLYLNKNDDLKKIDKISDLNIPLSILKLNIGDIMDYLSEVEIDSYDETTIRYYIPASYFVTKEEDDILIEIVGDNNLDKIIIYYPDCEIILEIGDENVENIG